MSLSVLCTLEPGAVGSVVLGVGVEVDLLHLLLCQLCVEMDETNGVKMSVKSPRVSGRRRFAWRGLDRLPLELHNDSRSMTELQSVLEDRAAAEDEPVRGVRATSSSAEPSTLWVLTRVLE